MSAPAMSPDEDEQMEAELDAIFGPSTRKPAFSPMNTTQAKTEPKNDQAAPPVTKPALGALVFACGARISCPDDFLPRFPIGRRYITHFSRDPGMARPVKAGAQVNCLLNCPCAVRKSGMVIERAWAANDPEREPGRMVRCKVAAHLTSAQVAAAAAAGKEAA